MNACIISQSSMLRKVINKIYDHVENTYHLITLQYKTDNGL